MTIQEAVLLIQTMERARQGRLRAKFMRDIRLQEERERLSQQRGKLTRTPSPTHQHSTRIVLYSLYPA